MRQLHSNTESLEWPHQKTNKLIGAVIHKQESRHKVPNSVLRAVLGRMQFTLHATRRTPHGASRLVQAMSAWLVKTRCAPSRHSKDARVHGHTTTAIHKLGTPATLPPATPPPASPLFHRNTPPISLSTDSQQYFTWYNSKSQQPSPFSSFSSFCGRCRPSSAP